MYAHYTKLIGEARNWSQNQHSDYQLKMLRRLIEFAYENTDYYRQVFDDRGLKPKDIRRIGDLSLLPSVDKETMRNNIHAFTPRNMANSRRLFMSTSGSTGEPFSFFISKDLTRPKERAFYEDAYGRAGYKRGDRQAVLRGFVVPGYEKGRYWYFDPVENRLILSTYHLSPATIPRYIEQIRRFRPKFIAAYPSAISMLASFMSEADEPHFKSVKAILLGSEVLHPHQRDLLEHVFQCRVFNCYGHAERAVLATPCEKSDLYHVEPEYGILELLRQDDVPTTVGEIGEITATSLDNYATVFIRYRTGDRSAWTNKTCGCGRSYPLLETIEGRAQSVLVSSDGRHISSAALNFHNEVYANIYRLQFYQDTPGEVILRIQAKPGYSSEHELALRRQLMGKLGQGFQLSIVPVTNIHLESSGKMTDVVQELPIQSK